MDEGLVRKKIYVIGIGYRPFDKRTKDIIMNAEIIFASKRLFDVFRRYEEFGRVKDRTEVINDVDATMNFIRAELSGPEPRSVVLLASGDPLFYGIGRRTVEEFGEEKVEIIPDLSSIQLAFSRIMESWDDAFLLSVHQGPAGRQKPRCGVEDIPCLLESHYKIAILTDRENNPAVIAREILRSPALSSQLSTIGMFVCERLGYPDERVIRGGPGEIALGQFSEPNVVIIIRKGQP